MKAKVTGKSAWQGTPDTGTLDIEITGRYVDSSGNATVSHYTGVLNDAKTGFKDARTGQDLYIIVQGPDDPAGPRATFREALGYADGKEVRTTFTRKLISTDLAGLFFDYAAPDPGAVPGFGDAPLSMQAAAEVLGQAAQVQQSLAEITQSKAALDLAAGTTPLANETALAGKPAGAYRLIASNEQVIWNGNAVTSRGPVAAPAVRLDAMQTSRAALVGGTLTSVGLPVGARLVDEYGPLRLRAAVGGEIPDNGVTYAVGTLIAEREDDGAPVQADWYGIPENTPGQTARWQAAADAAYGRKARRLDVADKNYVLDGVISTKASIYAPGAQFTVPLGNANTKNARITAVSDSAPVVYSDAPHLVAGSLPLTSFTPGLDLLKDGLSIVPALGTVAHQMLSIFSSVPSTHRANGALDETYERNDCVIPSPSGALNAPLTMDYAYPAAALAAVEWSAATVYKRGDFVTRTVNGQTYRFVATYPSGPGTTYHANGTAIGAVQPNETVVDTLSTVTGGTYGKIRPWMQLYRKISVYPRQRPIGLHVNVRVSSTLAAATNITLSNVVSANGRSDVFFKGVVDTDNANAQIDTLVSFANIAGLRIAEGTRVSGATNTGLGYNLLAFNVSRVTLSGVVSVGCRDGWAARHGNHVSFYDCEICKLDDHYGFDYFLSNVQLTTSIPLTFVYAVTFSGRNIALYNCTARNCYSLLTIRSDSAHRGGHLILRDCKLIPVASATNSGLVYGASVYALTSPIAQFDYGVPFRWPEIVEVDNCTIENSANNTAYGRIFVDFAMDGFSDFVLPREIRIKDTSLARSDERAEARLRFYGLPTRMTGTTKITVVNSRAAISPRCLTDGITSQADVDTAWAIRATRAIEYDIQRSTKLLLSPSLALPLLIRLTGSQVEAWRPADSPLPPAGVVSPVVIQGVSSVFGTTAQSPSYGFGPNWTTALKTSTFVDCDFLQNWTQAYADAITYRTLICRAENPAFAPTAYPGKAATGTVSDPLAGSVRRTLPINNTTDPIWVRLARIQSVNPVTNAEFSSFIGRISSQADFGQAGRRHAVIDFAFGSRIDSGGGGLQATAATIRPHYKAEGDGTLEMRVYQAADGFLDVYIQIPRYTRPTLIDYYLIQGSEPVGAWLVATLPADGTLLWSSLTGLAQGVRFSGPLRPGVVTRAGVPLASDYPSFLLSVSDPAAGKGRLIISDGAVWRYVSDDTAI